MVGKAEKEVDGMVCTDAVRSFLASNKVALVSKVGDILATLSKSKHRKVHDSCKLRKDDMGHRDVQHSDKIHSKAKVLVFPSADSIDSQVRFVSFSSWGKLA